MKVLRMNFTLVELLTVIAVIAILAGIAVPVIVGASAKGKETSARADMNAIKLALTQFKADYSVWPVPTATGDTMLPAAFQASDSRSDVQIDSMMQELTTIQFTPSSTTNGPQNFSPNINTRRRIYLDAPARPVQAIRPNGSTNPGFYKLDPWGRRYNIALDTDYNKQLILTTDFLPAQETIVGEIAIYSFGTAEERGDTDAYLYSWKTLAR